MHSLSSTLDGGEWLASCPGRFIPREGKLRTHWIGNWVASRAGLDAVVKRKFPTHAGTRTPDHPARSPALCHWVLWASRSAHKMFHSLCAFNKAVQFHVTSLCSLIVWVCFMNLDQAILDYCLMQILFEDTVHLLSQLFGSYWQNYILRLTVLKLSS
jgi:hypothetical protein